MFLFFPLHLRCPYIYLYIELWLLSVDFASSRLEPGIFETSMAIALQPLLTGLHRIFSQCEESHHHICLQLDKSDHHPLGHTRGSHSAVAKSVYSCHDACRSDGRCYLSC